MRLTIEITAGVFLGFSTILLVFRILPQRLERRRIKKMSEITFMTAFLDYLNGAPEDQSRPGIKSFLRRRRVEREFEWAVDGLWDSQKSKDEHAV